MILKITFNIKIINPKHAVNNPIFSAVFFTFQPPFIKENVFFAILKNIKRIEWDSNPYLNALCVLPIELSILHIRVCNVREKKRKEPVFNRPSSRRKFITYL